MAPVLLGLRVVQTFLLALFICVDRLDQRVNFFGLRCAERKRLKPMQARHGTPICILTL